MSPDLPVTGLAKMLYDLHHIEELTVCRHRDSSGRMYCIMPADHEGRHDFVYDTTQPSAASDAAAPES